MRIVLRWSWRLAAVAVAGLALGACQDPPGPSFTVTTAADGSDASPGDGVCEMTPGAGDCSLRAAVDEANADPTDHNVVGFAPGVDPVLSSAGAAEDDNATGDLDVVGPLTLVGNGSVVDAARLDRAIDHHAGRLVLHGVVIRGGEASTAEAGGGIRTLAGTLVVRESTLEGNRVGAGGAGGGLLVDGGTVRVERSTLVGNGVAGTGGEGGAIQVASGSLVVADSTLSANDAAAGAALHLGGGTGELVRTTVADNTGATAIVGTGDPVALRLGATIVSAADTACGGAITSLGHNLVSDASCGAVAPGDRPSTPAALGPLGDGGGPTATHLPAPGSAAHDAIPAPVPGLCEADGLVDQRGSARPQGVGCTIGAVETDGVSLGLDLVVTSAADGVDAVPGDGTCAAASGACTLRAAIDEANASPGADRITIAPGVDPVLAPRTAGGASEDQNTSGDLDVHGTVLIEGAGATVSGHPSGSDQQRDRVIDHHDGHLVLRGLTVTSGHLAGDRDAPDPQLQGGGVRARSSLTIEGGRLVGNQASGYYLDDITLDTIYCCGSGGALHVSDAAAVVRDTVIEDNRSEGAALTVGGASSLHLERSAVVDNATFVDGGGDGVAVGGTATVAVRSSTVSGNQGYGVGNLSSESTVLLVAATVTGNGDHAVAGPNVASAPSSGVVAVGSILDADGQVCAAPVQSFGWNMAPDASCGLGGATDQPGVEPLLAARSAAGPGSPVHLLDASSPGVDAVPPGTPLLCADGVTDQRGVARPIGAGCDIGAAEGSVTLAPLSLVVDTAADAIDAFVGDGTCADADGRCTLRAAIDEANASPFPATVTIAPGIDPLLTLDGSLGGGDDAATDLDVRGDLTLLGGGATIESTFRFGGRVIEHHAGTLVLDDVVITGGKDEEGGGVLAHSDLVVRDSTITGNEAYGTDVLYGDLGGSGGGIRALAPLVVERSTVSGNWAYEGGGGISVSATTATIVDSTIDGNETGTSALGAALRSWRSTVTVTNTTISGNLTPSTWGSTVLHEASSVPDPAWGVHLVASTVVGGDAHLLDGPAVTVRGSALLATGGEVCDDAPTSEGANVASDASCGLVASGDVEGADLALGLLADHGGPTQTHLPDPTSPLVDAVAVGTAGLCDGTVGADQRGVPRPQGLACDVGAVERSVDD